MNIEKFLEEFSKMKYNGEMPYNRTDMMEFAKLYNKKKKKKRLSKG